MCRKPTRRRPAGFTLVELLVVIIIIVILAGILIPTINSTRKKVLVVRITTEMKQLESALEQYKTDHGGDYPPDFTDFPLNMSPPSKVTNITAHLARGFSRHNRGAIVKWMASSPASQKPANLDAAEALVFWLSMLRNDAVFPLTDSSGNNVALSPKGGKAYFDFDPARLKDRDGDGWPEYYPKGVDDAPFVYFHAKTYLGAFYPQASPTPVAGAAPVGTARPYAEDVSGAPPKFFQPTKYQLLSSGLDNDFGVDTVANPPNQVKAAPTTGNPAGINLTKQDQDNLANFSEGKTIEGMRP